MLVNLPRIAALFRSPPVERKGIFLILCKSRINVKIQFLSYIKGCKKKFSEGITYYVALGAM
jgi:hypothetical protein